MQIAVLDEVASVHPNSLWWIKADGYNRVKRLTESVSGEWNGNVNLYPEALEKLFKEYKERLMDRDSKTGPTVKYFRVT